MSGGVVDETAAPACVIDFAHGLVTAAVNRQLHEADSAFVQEAYRDLVRALQMCTDSGVAMPLALQLHDLVLHFEGAPLPGPSLQAGDLLRRCRERNIAQILFHPDLTTAELDACFDLLLLDRNREALRRQTRDLALRAFGIRNIGFMLGAPAHPGDRRSDLILDDEALHQYQDLASCLQRNHMRAYRDLDLAIDDAAGLVERTIAEFDEPSSLLTLATQDDVDRFTVGHSVRVALLALQTARRLGLDRQQLIGVGTAALMHDIGKSKVPQEILWKNGHLDEDEWHYMAQHPRLGTQILLEQQAGIDPCVIGASFCHHMGPHGGYPDPSLPVRLSGTSHLVRVCDVFEALTSVRPYKKALSPVEAFGVMFRHENDFHPAWLRTFARAIGLFPNGTRVMLDDGADAMVLAQTKDPSRPVVRLLSGSGGEALEADAPTEIPTGIEFEGRTRRIAAVTTQDRCVIVPEFESCDPALTAPHACLSKELIADANETAKRSRQPKKPE